MRHTRSFLLRQFLPWGLALVLTLPALWGCARARDQAAARRELASISGELGQRNFDQAIRQADGFVSQKPGQPGSAEALYMMGRAYEDRPKADVVEARQNLAAARAAYQKALQASPSRLLEAYIRTSFGNVAFHQEDFATAAAQWTMAADYLDSAQLQGAVWLRVGVCQQRLGRWKDADHTLAMVAGRYGATSAAQLAREREGLRAFWVQLAVFKSGSSADRAVASLGGPAAGKVVRTVDSKGRHVLRLGPLPTYAQARALRDQYTSVYADAFVVP